MQPSSPEPVPERPAPTLVGWKEYIHFPEWGIRHVKAKLDTGARTSAIHVNSYDLYDQEGQGLMAELRLALHRRHPERMTVVRTPVLRMVVVTNSGGQSETRPVIRTTIRLGRVEKSILITVTNRANMLFRVLLGRLALAGDFWVDVGRKYLTREQT